MSGTGVARGVRVFLIADIRGYTLFTQEHGDEAAASLAESFAWIVREGVEPYGGRLIELRGDEALVAFESPRDAIAAAADLQSRFVDEALSRADAPLYVGIGLDAGEAVALEEGFRGGALNLAARLCSMAGPGEILASQEVVHLARAVDGVTYLDRGEARLKGLAGPVRVIRPPWHQRSHRVPCVTSGPRGEKCEQHGHSGAVRASRAFCSTAQCARANRPCGLLLVGVRGHGGRPRGHAVGCER